MYRRSINVFSQGSLKHINVTPEELYSKFDRPINQIDQYTQKEDKSCLKAKRDFRKNMRSSSQYTHVRSHGFINIEARPGSRATKRRLLEDFYLPGMPLELMTVNSKRKGITKKKRKSKKVKKRTNEGKNEASSEDEKGGKANSDSGSDREELDSNSSAAGDEAGDYADTYFDNGEDNIASDNSGGEGEYY